MMSKLKHNSQNLFWLCNVENFAFSIQQLLNFSKGISFNCSFLSTDRVLSILWWIHDEHIATSFLIAIAHCELKYLSKYKCNKIFFFKNSYIS